MIDGKVMHDGNQIGEMSGKWSDRMDYKDFRTGQSRTLFDAHNANAVQKTVPPLEQQHPNESQRYVRLTLCSSVY